MSDYTEAIASLASDDFEAVNGYAVNDTYTDGTEAMVSEQKNVTIDNTQCVLCCESDSQYIIFNLCRYYDGIDLSSKTLRVHFVNADGEHGLSTPINVYRSSDRIRLGWVVPHEATTNAGDVQVTIECVGSDGYAWSTRVTTLKVEESLLNMESSTPIIMLDDLYKYIDGSFSRVSNKEFADKAAEAGVGANVILYPLDAGNDMSIGDEGYIPDALAAELKHLDIVVDTEGGCMFQYKASQGSGDVVLPAESFVCILNPNSSGGGGGGSAFKRIGFTADCDYVATDSDGYSAFSRAVSNAKDGDVIVVMPGEYTGNYTLTFSKNVSFIGIGKPTIKFPITVGTASSACEVIFDNFEFIGKPITGIGYEFALTSELYFYNSRFYSSSVKLVGTFSNCNLDYTDVSCSLSYYGDSSLCMIHYYGCDIANSTMSGDCSMYRNCTIRECSTPQGYEVSYSECALYNFNGRMGAAYQTYLSRCAIYGNRFPESDYPPNYYESYFIACDAL